MSVEGSEIAEVRAEAVEASGDVGEPTKFEEGFTGRTIIGALFIVFIMLPGALYLGLVAGQGLGSAAQWVTIVLFAEIARRSFVTLKRQEIYMLFYVAGTLVVMNNPALGLSGGPFANLIWMQFLVQSPQAAAIAHQLPGWVVPHPGSQALIQRTFFHRDWLWPIIMLVTQEIFSRMTWMGLGYALFRVTSDTERLPFPMAPVAVAGATALAEAQKKEESWRWQVFSIGTMIGLIFGTVYLAIPIFTGVVLSKPVMLIPIPFIDFTKNTENILPAALTGLSGDLSNVLIGFVLPFEMLGGMVVTSVLCQIGANPILRAHGMLPTWRPGMGTIDTQLSTSLDFWMSVGIGISVAVALVGIVSVVRSSIKAQEQARGRRAAAYTVPRGRGDFPIGMALGVWLLATLGNIIISHRLVGAFPLWILIAFGLFYSPIMSYVNARMFGLTGMGIGLPMVREATILKSGYKGVDIWFAPLPMYDVGGIAQRFREVELTGTKFTSVLKAEIFMLPVILISSFLFWYFFWHTSPIPSPQFPYAQKFWPIQATMQTIWVSSNQMGGKSWLIKALKPNLMYGGGIAALAMFGVLSFLKVPMLYFYGAAGGVNALPHSTIPMFFGAMLGRKYFAKRFGVEKWRSYAPVLLAGFSCGMGLIGMSAIALALISKSVSYLPY